MMGEREDQRLVDEFDMDDDTDIPLEESVAADADAPFHDAFVVDDELHGERLDKHLANRLRDVSRTEIQRWMDDGLLLVNGHEIKSNYRVRRGDSIVIDVPPPRATELVPERVPLDIYFEDRDMLVVNKPRGMVVHPAHGHATGTLVHALLGHCNDLSGIGGELRPGIVHRIDKDTSGLLMVAKNDLAHRSLADQLRHHTVKRVYIALVHGLIDHGLGTIDAPIGRSRSDRQSMAVDPDEGKHAVTHFSVMERFSDYTLLSLQLETGRTHQIRVHMAYIGHPVVGDPKYGRKKTLPIAGQALHAHVIGFTHPRTEEWMEFTAPIPDDMERLVAQLRSAEV